MQVCTNMVMTPQEQHLCAKVASHITNRERTLRIAERIRNSPVCMDISRGWLFTESMKQTEGEYLPMRWAKGLLHIAEHIPVLVAEDELIVGKTSGVMGRRGILYPELEGSVLMEIETASRRTVSPYDIDPEDLTVIREEIYPYWKNKSYAQAYVNNMPPETRRFFYGDDSSNHTVQQAIVVQGTTGRSSLNWNVDYPGFLKRGVCGLLAEAREKLDAFKNNPSEYIRFGGFWESCIVTLRAFSTYAKRYAAEAGRLAGGERNEQRKAELKRIAENCAWVAENPPRNFWEALQLQWFIAAFSRLEQHIGAGLGNGRMDQFLYPYYSRDIEEGTLTRQQARELLECFWLNLAQIPILFTSDNYGATHDGFAHFETVTIGGQTPDGKDATNELSYLILESKRDFPIPYPDLAARIHSGTPDRFLKACCETIKDGQGFPKLVNDEEIIPLYVAKGEKLKDAFDFACSGCTEVRIAQRESYVNPGPFLNLASVIELTLRNGRLLSLGPRPFGLETGDPRSFKSYDEFYAALRRQYEYLLYQATVQQAVADRVKPAVLAAPFQSVTTPACRAASTGIYEYVPDSFREIYMDQVGFATLTDSVAAVKKLVYEEKRFTMAELIDALDANFKGYEVIRQLVLNAPKYGNDDPYADEVGRALDEITAEFVARHRGLHGEIFSSRMVPVTNHILAGKRISATPNGRLAWEYLSEGCGASHGCDMQGPTAVLLSNKRIKHEGCTERAARLLNIKWSPTALAGDEGTRKLMNFIRTWCDLRLWHIQFNVINKNTLEKARADPENYRNLIVRVAGYSAYFCELSSKLQDEIIARTEHSI